ncbi:MAG: hypothetical protein HRT83_01215 [Hyphomicrobiaceae bacterium]|nr:hypothetical protein [Hyphomicrobiaceae bacterium]
MSVVKKHPGKPFHPSMQTSCAVIVCPSKLVIITVFICIVLFCREVEAYFIKSVMTTPHISELRFKKLRGVISTTTKTLNVGMSRTLKPTGCEPKMCLSTNESECQLKFGISADKDLSYGTNYNLVSLYGSDVALARKQPILRTEALIASIQSPRANLTLHTAHKVYYQSVYRKRVLTFSTSHTGKCLQNFQSNNSTLAPYYNNKCISLCLGRVKSNLITDVGRIQQLTLKQQLNALNFDQRKELETSSNINYISHRARATDDHESLAQQKLAGNFSSGIVLQALLNKQKHILRDGLLWTISRFQGDRAIAVKRTTKSVPFIPLTPGRYLVALETSVFVGSKVIEVKKAERVVVPFSINAALVTFTAFIGKHRHNVEGAIFEIKKVAEDSSLERDANRLIWLGPASNSPLILEPGEYELIISAGYIRQSQFFRAVAGQKTSLNVLLEGGYLSVRTNKLSQDHANSSVVVSIQSYHPEMISGSKVIVRTAQTNPSFLLPIGTYLVNVEGSIPVKEELVTITSGQRLQHTPSPHFMLLHIISKFNGNDKIIKEHVRYNIGLRRIGPLASIIRSSAMSKFKLAPGQYYIVAKVGEHNVVITKQFEITTASSGKIILNVNAGTVLLSSGAQDRDIYWEVRDEDEQTVLMTTKKAPKLILKPGRYRVHADIGNEKIFRQIMVKNGRQTHIEISP